MSFNENIEKFTKIFKEENNIIPFIVIGSLVTFVVYQIYSAIINDDQVQNYTKYFYYTLIPLIILFSYIIYVIFDNKSQYMFFLISISTIIGFLIIYSLLKISNFKFNFTLQSLFSYAFIGFIILFGLSIFYSVFQNELRTTDTWGSFWVEMIFYLPCMLDMFIKYILNDYANTSTRTVIMFIIEIILIISYLWLYPIYKKSIYNNGIIIQQNPVFLNKVVSNLIRPIKDSGTNKAPDYYLNNNPLNWLIKQDTSIHAYRKNYAISMWIFVNPMPMSRLGYDEETNIFLYGTGWNSKTIGSQDSTDPVEYHPRLSMTQENDNYLFNFYYSGNTAQHQMELPLQKWNNVVFNYVGTGVDVFINGEFKLSYNFSDDMPNYSDEDDIIIGDTNGYDIFNSNIIANGLYGSICNIVYYKDPLSKRDIVMNYNLLVVNNPPLIE